MMEYFILLISSRVNDIVNVGNGTYSDMAIVIT